MNSFGKTQRWFDLEILFHVQVKYFSYSPAIRHHFWHNVWCQKVLHDFSLPIRLNSTSLVGIMIHSICTYLFPIIYVYNSFLNINKHMFDFICKKKCQCYRYISLGYVWHQLWRKVWRQKVWREFSLLHIVEYYIFLIEVLNVWLMDVELALLRPINILYFSLSM